MPWKSKALHALALLVATLFVMFAPIIAWAADAVASVAAGTAGANPQKWWQALLEPVLYLVGTALAAVIVAVLGKLIYYIETKLKIDIPASIEDLVKDKALVLIAAAEEKAENKLLHGDGTQTPGTEKLSWVLDELQVFAEKLGYGKTWQRDKLTTLIEGLLHLNRVDNEGIGSSTLDPRGVAVNQKN